MHSALPKESLKEKMVAEAFLNSCEKVYEPLLSVLYNDIFYYGLNTWEMCADESLKKALREAAKNLENYSLPDLLVKELKK